MKKNNDKTAAGAMLEVGGRKLPCRITMGAMVLFKRATGKSPSAFSEDDIEEMVQFVYCCVKSACIADGVGFDMDFDEFACRLEPGDMTAFYERLNTRDASGEKKAGAATPT